MLVRSIIGKIFNHSIEFVFPKICVICKNKINQNNISNYTNFCCKYCFNSFRMADEHDNIEKILMEDLKDDMAISNAFSLFSAKNTDEVSVMELIYKLKYEGLTQIGIELGELLGKLLFDYNMIDYDLVIPVPIHKARRRERGYNQSEFIAKGVNNIIKSNVYNNLLYRRHYTITQTKLSKEERAKNLKNVFFVKFDERNNISGKKILLVDDVLTSGYTLNNCAIALLENKVRQVDIVTIVHKE